MAILAIIAVIALGGYAYGFIKTRELSALRKEMKLYVDRMEAAELDLHAIRSVAEHRGLIHTDAGDTVFLTFRVSLKLNSAISAEAPALKPANAISRASLIFMGCLLIRFPMILFQCSRSFRENS